MKDRADIKQPASLAPRRQPLSDGPTYPSVEHLARDIGVSRQACYRAIKSGVIPHIKIGRRIILPRAAISDWLKNAGRGGHDVE